MASVPSAAVPSSVTPNSSRGAVKIFSVPAQTTRRVEFFAARGALDIESVGGIVADKLVERGLVREALDLFELKVDQLGKLNLGTEEAPRLFGEKNATKAINAIERARTLPLSRWLFALAIPDVGKTTAMELARFHNTIHDVAHSELLRGVLEYHEKREGGESSNEIAERLIKAGFAKPSKSKMGKGGIVTEVGPVVADSVLDFFASTGGKRILRRLNELGIHPKSERVSAKKAAELPMAGKTFVLTGTLAFNDARRSHGKNRSARRACHRQREQENGLRPRRLRTGQQIRQERKNSASEFSMKPRSAKCSDVRNAPFITADALQRRLSTQSRNYFLLRRARHFF